MSIKTLVVENQPLHMKETVNLLSDCSLDLSIDTAASVDDAISLFRNSLHDMVITDWSLGGGANNGITLVRQLRQDASESRRFVYQIMVTGVHPAGLEEALSSGADEFLLKEQRATQLIPRVSVGCRIIEHVRAIKALGDDNDRLRCLSDIVDDDGELGFINESRCLDDAIEYIRRAAKVRTPVLILGESGTGKELVARAVHKLSDRSAKQLNVVNCATLTGELLNSRLFGHEKGAFTGATERCMGEFEVADGSSIFLDELGEMERDTQARLLRVLEEGTLKRVGGREILRPDVRLIAATNADLEDLVAKGDFREDLYYRLKVLTIQLPPLRHRREDIIPLAQHFLNRYRADLRKPTLELAQETRDVLVNYSWPGNIRELRNAIERAVILANSEQIFAEELGLPMSYVAMESFVPTAPANGLEVDELARSIAAEINRHRRGDVVNLRELTVAFEAQLVATVYNSSGSKVDKASRLGVTVDQYSRLVTKHVKPGRKKVK